jgi:hypothetical protein
MPTRRGLAWRVHSPDSNRSLLFGSGNSAGKRFGEARDRGGIFGVTGPIAETTLSRVTGGKATESQRLFRRRQESGIAPDWVVGLVGLKPTTN